MKRSIFWIILLGAALLTVIQFPVNAATASNKDVILVLDTSLSMRGYGGKNIFEDVKQSVNQFIDKLQDGDRVTFITFDEVVKTYPQVILDDQNDRDIVKKYISMTEAHGQWTSMLAVLQTAFAMAKTLSDSDAGGVKRETMIVIMSDGIDDPPPGKERFSLKDISQQYQGNDWWIYVVNLAEMEKSGKISSSLAQFKKDLEGVSQNTMFLDGSADPNKAMVDVQKDVERKQFIQQRVIPAVAIILALIIIIGSFIYFRVRKLKVKGVLEFWNHELLKPDVHRFDLTPLSAREIVVGRVAGCNVKIREFESRIPFTLKAQSRKGQVVNELLHAEGLDIGFKNKELDGFVNNGDIFTASNYTFRYLSE